MRKGGVPIVSVGKKKYPGSRAFEMYAIEGAYRTVYRLDEVRGVMVVVRVALQSRKPECESIPASPWKLFPPPDLDAASKRPNLPYRLSRGADFSL